MGDDTTTCVCCRKRPGTKKVWNGSLWCRSCLRQAKRENAQMCRSVGGRRVRRVMRGGA